MAGLGACCQSVNVGATGNGQPAESGYDLGVLVVHGIGNQKQGRTLTAWVDSIVAWLNTWSPDDRTTWKQPAATVTRASLRPSTDEPASLEMNLRFEVDSTDNSDSSAGHRKDDEYQRWLFAEGWWAGTFDPPSFTELWSWSFMSVPATAAMHANAIVSAAIARYSFTESGWQKGLEVLRILAMLASLLILVILSPIVLAVFTALFVAGLVASLVPIDALKNFVAKAQLVAIGTIGDTKRLTDSPTQAGAIKAPIVEGLQYLRDKGCRRVVVLAHSQGAAVTYKALLDLVEEEKRPEVMQSRRGFSGAPSKALVPIDSFLTVGSGINKVHALEHLGTASGYRNLRTASLAIPIAAVAASLSIRQLELDGALLSLAAIGGAFSLALAAVFWRTYGDLESERSAAAADDDDDMRANHPVRMTDVANRVLDDGIGAFRPSAVSPASVLVVVGLIATIVFVVIADRGLLALGTVLAIALAFLSVITIAADKIPPVDQSLRGTGTRRWVDLYAGRDPVPAGPTRTHDDGWPTTWRVSNLGSLARDHNTYTVNADECLTFIGVELLEVAELGSLQADSVRAKTAVYGFTRRWRVGWRNLATWVLITASALFTYRTWGLADDDVRRWYGDLRSADGLVEAVYPGSLPGWLPDSMSLGWARFVAAIGYLLIAAALVNLGQAVWSAWDRSESRRELGPGPSGGGEPAQFTALVALLVIASVIAVNPRWVLGRWSSIDLSDWGDLAMIVVTVAAIAAFAQLLPRLLRSTHLQEWVMSRYNTRVEAQLQFGEAQLERGQPDEALRTFVKAEEAATRADWGTRFAVEGMTRAQALVHQHHELTKIPYVSEAGAPLDLDRLEVATRAEFRRLFRSDQSSVRLLIAGANHNTAAGYPRTAQRFLAEVPVRQRTSGTWLAAAIGAYHGDPEARRRNIPLIMSTGREIDPVRAIGSQLQDQQLVLLFAVLASNGPDSVASPWPTYLGDGSAAADGNGAGPITIRSLLASGVRAPAADLRPFLSEGMTAEWSDDQRRLMQQAARWILGLEPVPDAEPQTTLR